jgi:hypothetical protein
MPRTGTRSSLLPNVGRIGEVRNRVLVDRKRELSAGRVTASTPLPTKTSFRLCLPASRA